MCFIGPNLFSALLISSQGVYVSWRLCRSQEPFGDSFFSKCNSTAFPGESVKAWGLHKGAQEGLGCGKRSEQVDKQLKKNRPVFKSISVGLGSSAEEFWLTRELWEGVRRRDSAILGETQSTTALFRKDCLLCSC